MDEYCFSLGISQISYLGVEYILVQLFPYQ